jgi:hypothetical protein
MSSEKAAILVVWRFSDWKCFSQIGSVEGDAKVLVATMCIVRSCSQGRLVT